MKKILLAIFLILLIFQMVVLAIAIDIGNEAIDRPTSAPQGYTYVDYVNSANTTGKITSVEIWANQVMSNCEVAIFYVVSGNNLSTRSTATIGSVASGSKQTFLVNLDVTEGDYIGIYFSNGAIEKTASGSGHWTVIGDKIPCTNTAFTPQADRMMSLYGTGETAAVGIKWNTVTISKWNGQVITKWNGLQ